MKVSGAFEKILNKYGQTTTLVTKKEGDEVHVHYRSLISPLLYKNKMYIEGIHTKTGYADQSHYLYIGPAMYDLTSLPDNSYIKASDRCYFIKKAEKVYLHDDVFYIWAVLTPFTKEAV